MCRESRSSAILDAVEYFVTISTFCQKPELIKSILEIYFCQLEPNLFDFIQLKVEFLVDLRFCALSCEIDRTVQQHISD